MRPITMLQAVAALLGSLPTPGCVSWFNPIASWEEHAALGRCALRGEMPLVTDVPPRSQLVATGPAPMPEPQPVPERQYGKPPPVAARRPSGVAGERRPGPWCRWYPAAVCRLKGYHPAGARVSLDPETVAYQLPVVLCRVVPGGT